MKKIIAAILLSSAASLAMAHHGDLANNPDLYASPLLDHSAAASGEPLKGEGDLYGSIIENPDLFKSDPNAKVEPWTPADEWKTRGDLYQNVMFGDQS